jgi:phospholipase D3/4
MHRLTRPRAPWRDEARDTFSRLGEHGVQLHFVSNSSSTFITQRLRDLFGDNSPVAAKISVQSDAGKFRICELNWDNKAAVSDEARRRFRALYEALRAAAQRGVHIRILQGPGFSGPRQESDALQADFPDRISIHSVDMGKWYGGGIMHQKVWIFDQRHLYLGSTNMDWKSITQVKEMGVVVEDCPELAADAGKYFEAWWAFAALSPTSVQVFDPVARIDRRVPPWSILVPAEQRAKSTLASGESATACNWKAPLSLDLGGERGTVFLTGCPQEVLDSGRTWDQEGLVRTIEDARKSVCVT